MRKNSAGEWIMDAESDVSRSVCQSLPRMPSASSDSLAIQEEPSVPGGSSEVFIATSVHAPAPDNSSLVGRVQAPSPIQVLQQRTPTTPNGSSAEFVPFSHPSPKLGEPARSALRDATDSDNDDALPNHGIWSLVPPPLASKIDKPIARVVRPEASANADNSGLEGLSHIGAEDVHSQAIEVTRSFASSSSSSDSSSSSELPVVVLPIIRRGSVAAPQTAWADGLLRRENTTVLETPLEAAPTIQSIFAGTPLARRGLPAPQTLARRNEAQLATQSTPEPGRVVPQLKDESAFTMQKAKAMLLQFSRSNYAYYGSAAALIIGLALWIQQQQEAEEDPFEEPWSQEKQRKQRRFLKAIAVAIAVLGAAGIIAYVVTDQLA